MVDDKGERIQKAVKKITGSVRVRDATQLRGKVKIVTSSTILKLINDIVARYTGKTDRELLTRLTEMEFELLKLRRNSEMLREDLERAREESFAKDATIKDLTGQLAEILAMAERREKEVRQLSKMIKTRDAKHAEQVGQLEASFKELESLREKESSGPRRAPAIDPQELQKLREEVLTLQSELRMSEDIEEMQRSEIAGLEEQLGKGRLEYENQISALSRKIDQFERELQASTQVQKKLRTRLTRLVKTEKPVEKRVDTFGKTAVQLGYCTDEQVREARHIQKNISGMGLAPPTLSDVLVDKGYLTEGQVTEVFRTLTPGQLRIEGYKLLAKLGEGLLGTSYKARQISLDREVALKIVRREFSVDKEYASHFLDRAKQAGRLHHKNIARIIDAGRVDETCYAITEYVKGMTLRDVLRKKGKLAERQLLHIGLQAAHALSEAHKNGLTHGDIKPSNIIVTSESTIKVCDFGLGKLIDLKTEFTLPYGFFEGAYYTSPEVVRGGSSDIRSDIYSLGATLFHLATGAYLFGKAPTPREALLAHLNPPRSGLPDPREKNPEISQSAAQIIARMLEPMPDDRYQEPKDLISALVELIKQRKSDSSTRRTPRRAPHRKRHR